MSVENPSDETARLSSVLEWREPVSSGRVARAVAISVGVHVLAFIIFVVTPNRDVSLYRPVIISNLQDQSTKLYLPPDVLEQKLTQRDENKGKVREELNIQSALPAAPSAPEIRDFRPPTPQGRVGPAPVDTGPIEEAPELEVQDAQGVTEIAGIPRLPELTPPKVIMEDVSPTREVPGEGSRVSAPRPSVQQPLTTVRPGGGGGGGSPSTGSKQTPSSAPAMQLLTDPEGVDFKPYLIDVLAKVRKNWFSVVPEDARRGRPGAVTVEFSIARDGSVPKVVLARPSGIQAYNLHSVGSISMSEPFPRLPSDFKGNEIRLKLAFTYNLPDGR